MTLQEQEVNLVMVPGKEDINDENFWRLLDKLAFEVGDPFTKGLEEQQLFDISPMRQKHSILKLLVTNEIIVTAIGTLGPAAFTVLGMWLKGKMDRRVRIKIGDIEAEASSVDEIKELLGAARTSPKTCDTGI